MSRLTGMLGKLRNSDFARGLENMHGQGKDDDRRAVQLAKESKGEDFSNATMWEMMGGTYPTGYRVRELAGRLPGPLGKAASAMTGGVSDPAYVEARDKIGIGLSNKGTSELAGEVAGTLTNDFVGNRSRNYWWLLNAPQAVVDVASDSAYRKAKPDLYGSSPLQRDSGVFTYNPTATNKDAIGYAQGQGWMSQGDNPVPKKGINSQALRQVKPGDFSSAGEANDQARSKFLRGMGVLKENDSYDPQVLSRLNEDQLSQLNRDLGSNRILMKRNAEPGMVNTLNLPAQVAINTGIGMMNPFGGQEGYKAVFESEDDPAVSANPLAEVAAKYILGRTGNLLAWDEFNEARPDVSKNEYGRYKAFKFDKEADLNPFDDGKMTAPTGVLKYTQEGIHGPEVQFLGRSLPVATAIMPTAAAVAGTAAGLRATGGRGKVLGGLIGGILGAATGMGGGNLIEGERRRRNQLENEADALQYQSL